MIYQLESSILYMLKFINTIFFSYVKLYLFVNKCIKKRNKSSFKKQISYVKKLRKYIYFVIFYPKYNKYWLKLL